MVNGMSDDLLMSVVRAWDTTGLIDGRKIMNTAMWRHPIARKQVKVLEEDWGSGEDGEGQGWITVLRPMEKELGAMMDWRAIIGHVRKYLTHETSMGETGGRMNDFLLF